MAYTPTEWSCGDTITADKLNNIERGVADIMSDYVPTEWKCGDTITAEKMNKIEQGIANCGGGSSDMITLPKLTVTLNIDDTSHIDFWGLGNAIGINGGFATVLPFDAPHTTQVWEGYIPPRAEAWGDNQSVTITYPSGVVLLDFSYNGYYSLNITNMVNGTEDPEAPGSMFITDPSQPASFTCDAVYTPY